MEKQIIKTINPFDNYGFDSDTEFIPNGMPVVKVSPEDNMITISNGTISSTIKLDIENGILSLIGVDDKVISSVTLPLASAIKDAYFDDETNEVVLIVELSDGTEKEVKFSINFSEYATKEDIKTINDNLVTSINAINKNMVDGFNTINGGINNEIRPELEKAVKYTTFDTNRKTIQLNNHDTISGLMTNGTGANIAMVSKWDVADFGSTQLPINLNGSEERPTYNDTKEVALLGDVESETTRAKEAESGITSALTTETDRAIAAETKIANDLASEVTARGEADTQLQADLATEATTARAAEKANADAIVAEKERAEGIEAKLRTDVDYCGQRINEDLENTSKALEYKVQWDESKSKIVLPSGGQLVGTKYGADGSNPADGAVIAQLNEWDVMDFGSTKFVLNLNVPSGVRPTVQEAGQSGAEANKIAYLSDIEELKTIIATLTQRIEALESK
jgi:hypothetical protein